MRPTWRVTVEAAAEARLCVSPPSLDFHRPGTPAASTNFHGWRWRPVRRREDLPGWTDRAPDRWRPSVALALSTCCQVLPPSRVRTRAAAASLYSLPSGDVDGVGIVQDPPARGRCGRCRCRSGGRSCRRRRNGTRPGRRRRRRSWPRPCPPASGVRMLRIDGDGAGHRGRQAIRQRLKLTLLLVVFQQRRRWRRRRRRCTARWARRRCPPTRPPWHDGGPMSRQGRCAK